ncbi:MAG: hypothetical protein F6K19_29215 [Cyanothece sp. SIO1E1]|nr:hypothetical protein [Cyanothece sp. SIO1E1]
MSVIKTVVELDLVGYSDLVREIEESLGSKIVFELNDQIQNFVDSGLTKVGKTRENVVLATNGDNAILLFEDATDAHNFSKAVQEHTKHYNSQKATPSAERWFRIGCATGEVFERSREVTGFVIAKAYRLEAKTRPGGILIDDNTYNALPLEIQAEYGEVMEVPGKRNEKFKAHFWGKISVEQATVEVRDVLELFDQLQPRDQLSRLMRLVKIPKVHRPSNDRSVYERQEAILDWMEDQPDGLKKLAQELQELVKRQNPQ